MQPMIMTSAQLRGGGGNAAEYTIMQYWMTDILNAVAMTACYCDFGVDDTG